jgi:hypothetical protein
MGLKLVILRGEGTTHTIWHRILVDGSSTFGGGRAVFDHGFLLNSGKWTMGKIVAIRHIV